MFFAAAATGRMDALIHGVDGGVLACHAAAVFVQQIGCSAAPLRNWSSSESRKAECCYRRQTHVHDENGLG